MRGRADGDKCEQEADEGGRRLSQPEHTPSMRRSLLGRQDPRHARTATHRPPKRMLPSPQHQLRGPLGEHPLTPLADRRLTLHLVPPIGATLLLHPSSLCGAGTARRVDGECRRRRRSGHRRHVLSIRARTSPATERMSEPARPLARYRETGRWVIAEIDEQAMSQADPPASTPPPCGFWTATDDPLRPEDPVAAYLQIDTRLRSPATGYRARLLAQSVASVSVPVRQAAAHARA
jgi:hypothetical protein